MTKEYGTRTSVIIGVCGILWGIPCPTSTENLAKICKQPSRTQALTVDDKNPASLYIRIDVLYYHNSYTCGIPGLYKVKQDLYQQQYLYAGEIVHPTRGPASQAVTFQRSTPGKRGS